MPPPRCSPVLSRCNMHAQLVPDTVSSLHYGHDRAARGRKESSPALPALHPNLAPHNYLHAAVTADLLVIGPRGSQAGTIKPGAGV
jgi:hypothetical protein